MKIEYHPVSLHVIRGALEYAGFRVTRIRCTVPATRENLRAEYKISVAMLKHVPAWQLKPSDVAKCAEGAFAADVSVIRVEYNGQSWAIVIRVQVEDGEDESE